MKDRQGFRGSIGKQKITEESRRICQSMAEFVQSFGLLIADRQAGEFALEVAWIAKLERRA